MIARELEQARTMRACQEARTAVSLAEGQELENVAEFRHLGRQVTEQDSDLPALRRNLQRARQKWAQLSNLMVRDGATHRVSGHFHKAVVKAALLCGSEMWAWTKSMLLCLRGFHHKVARRMTGLSACRHNGGWVHPPIGEALEAAGLLAIEEHIACRRNDCWPTSQHVPSAGSARQPRGCAAPPTPLRCGGREQFTVDNNPFVWSKCRAVCHPLSED